MPDEPTTPDSELLGAWLKRRDEKAFHALVARYAVLVHHAARRICDDDSLAADASQATFITLVRKARSLSGRPSLAGWLHVTAVLQTRNLVRQRQRENRKHERLRSHMDLSPQAAPAVASTTTTTWNRLQPHLDQALSALSDSDRETLLLRFYRSLSIGEIAATLGIATAAAQKRLDRATERLRRQLARRGCTTTGSELGSAILAGFAADSHSLIPSPSLLAGKAISAGAATGATLTTTIGIIVMTKKAATLAGAAVLLLGAGAYLATHQNSANAADASTANAVADRPGNAGTRPTTTPADELADKAKVRKDREAAHNADLVSKYGESRTNLSKKIVGDVTSLLQDAVDMGQMMTSGETANAFGGQEGRLRRGLGATYGKLELTDEQKEKVNAAYNEFQKSQIEKTKGTIEDLKKNPDTLMSVFLAGDAYKRGEMSEADYKQYQQDHAADIQKVINPLDEKNLRGQPLRNPAFTSAMSGILDPTQTETFQAAVTEDTQKAARNDTDISNLPVMDLEKLDTTISSARKYVSGIKSMMEAAGGLQDLGPLMEAQKKAKEGQ
jgi:RNA polymerase sigma factor (sigma-70 family)